MSYIQLHDRLIEFFGHHARGWHLSIYFVIGSIKGRVSGGVKLWVLLLLSPAFGYTCLTE
jgi:hypothetical protein